MNSKLSVIVPVYKVEQYLRHCLDSIVNQSYENLEIILVDDGSPDHCGEICDEYAKRDSRIIVLHKQNEGLCAARNDGIDRACGEWLTFVDSDDWCETNYYEKMFEELGEQTADVFMAGGHLLEFEDKQVLKYNGHEREIFHTKEKTDCLMAKILAPQCGAKDDGVYASSAGLPWDKLYRTEFIKENQLYFDRGSRAWEDLLFNFCVFDKAKEVIVGTCMGYHYRMNNTSITKSYNPKREEINYYFIEKLKNYMEKREENALIEDAIRARSINMIANLLKCYYFNPQNPDSYHQVAKKVRMQKKKPYYNDAIWHKGNRLLSKGQKKLQLLLRLPFVFLLKMAISYRIKQKY